jgi:hypothetical protein
MHKSQKQRIIAKLKRDGTVSRNGCLSQFPAITRLGAIIQSLEDDGYEFKVNNWKKEKDCIYTWTNKPPEKEIIIYEKDGIMVAREVIKQNTLI